MLATESTGPWSCQKSDSGSRSSRTWYSSIIVLQKYRRLYCYLSWGSISARSQTAPWETRKHSLCFGTWASWPLDSFRHAFHPVRTSTTLKRLIAHYHWTAWKRARLIPSARKERRRHHPRSTTASKPSRASASLSSARRRNLHSGRIFLMALWQTSIGGCCSYSKCYRYFWVPTGDTRALRKLPSSNQRLCWTLCLSHHRYRLKSRPPVYTS